MYLQHPHIRESIREGGLPIAVYTRWSHTDSHKMSLSLPLVHATEWESKMILNVFLNFVVVFT